MKNNLLCFKRTFVAFTISVFSLTLFAENTPIGYSVIVHTVLSRGLEIRYVVVEDSKEREKKEIEVEGKKYALYKTRQQAVDAVTNAIVKQDLTIVYVISDTEKEKEIIEIGD